jgi:hypothetical protein
MVGCRPEVDHTYGGWKKSGKPVLLTIDNSETL